MSTAVRIIAVGVNRRGDLLTTLVRPLFTSLGYNLAPSNVAKTGREHDLVGVHRYERHRVLVECRARVKATNGTDLNTFAGKIDSERDRFGMSVKAYDVSLGGYTGPAIEQEFDRSEPRMVLLDGAQLVEALIENNIVVGADVAICAVTKNLSTKARVEGGPVLVGCEGIWLWAVRCWTPGGPPAVCMIHADGTALEHKVARAVIETARAAGDELGDCRLLNRIEASIEARAEVARRYRGYVKREYGSITLEGLPADASLGHGRFSLERLYEPLGFRDHSPVDTGERRNRLTGDDATATAVGKVFNLRRLLKRHRHIVIVGLPGSGKTTLIKRLAVAYADRFPADGFADLLPDERLFPVVIRCRQLSACGEMSIRAVIGQLAEHMEIPEQREAFEALVLTELREGRLLLLVDGLDEIADGTARVAFTKQLGSFVAMHPMCRVVVTSREAGFQGVERLASAWFATVRVQELTDQGIESLVRRWHAEVFGASPDSTDKAKRVAESIVENPAVRSLAGSPLLLTTLLLVQRSMGGRLPQQRTALYDKAIEVLLSTWNTEAHHPLNPKEAIAQLAYAAYHMKVLGKSSVTADELLELIANARSEVNRVLGFVQMSADEFLHRIEHRTSLLIRSGSELIDGRLQPIYEFNHLTFQEFLAATAIFRGWVQTPTGSSNLSDLLANRLADDSWQEVVSQAIVLCGIHGEPVVEELVDRLAAVPVENSIERLNAVAGKLLEPAAVLCANVVTCLRDEADILPELAERAMRVALDHCGLTSLVPPSPGRALRGGRYDARIREIIFELYQMDHLNPIPVAGELAHLAFADCEAQTNHHSQYDHWILNRLDSPDEQQRLYGAGAAMRVAFKGAKGMFPEPPTLPLSSCRIFDLIRSAPPREDRQLLLDLWAAAWLMQYAVPGDLKYLNALQVDLARLCARLEHPECARMAAWTLSSSQPAGTWKVSPKDKDGLLAFAHRHTTNLPLGPHQGLQRVQSRSGFLIRWFLEREDERTLIGDISAYATRCPPLDNTIQTILVALGPAGCAALDELQPSE